MPPAGARRPSRLGLPRRLNWMLLAYGALAVAIGWAYAVTRINADYEQSLNEEHSRLRGVTAALEAGTLAMLNDGVGAAVAGANELESGSDNGVIHADAAEIIRRLQHELTGGDYVRFLFLTNGERYAVTGRNGGSTSHELPSWLTVENTPRGQNSWVGTPIADPERPNSLVIPIAVRVSWGKGMTLWAGALFSFEGFDDLYRKFGDQVALIGLVAADGTVLVRSTQFGGHDTAVGDNIASLDVFRRAVAQGNSGIVEGYGSILRQLVIYSHQELSGYPMSIVAGQAKDSALAPWRARRDKSIAATAAFSALVMVMTAQLNHYILSLRRRERHYRTLFNNAQFSAFLLEGDRFVDANRTAVTMFGLDSERSAAGLAPWDLSPEHQPDGQRSEDLVRERLDAALRDGGHTFEWSCKRLDSGEVFPAEMDLSSLSTGNSVLALVVIHDVTVRRRAEQALGTLSARLIQLQDEERRRIGRDLHDSTGQTLAALELGLAQLKHESGSVNARRELLEHCARLANQCSTEIRTASYLLHPPLLDDLGLLSALRWLADGFHHRSSIKVRLDLPDTMARLPPDKELSLFRVAQEALTNIHRHSGSPWAAIRLRVQPDSVMIEIEDGGRGIASEQHTALMGAGPSLGVGLAGMRERIRQIGGGFSVESSSTGTRVRATLGTA
jgi:PAS domain S-box-containing protein